MTRWIEHSAVVLAVIACASLVMWLARFRRPALPALCRGPARPWFHALLPWNWLHTHGCWYDLSGSIPDTEGLVLCPECGTRQARTARRRRPSRWRTERIALLLLLSALACWKVRWIRYGGWVPYAPTPVLLAIEQAGSGWAPSRIRHELWDRSAGMCALNRAWLCRVATGALGRDSVRDNACWGCEILFKSVPASILSLEHALSSTNHQRRQVACMVLMRLIDGEGSPFDDACPPLPAGYAPPRLIYKVAAEGLADDEIGYREGLFEENATAAFPFLARHASEATRELELALGSADAQQRLLASAAVALGRHPTLADHGAEYLCTSLGEDKKTGNAVFAYQALWRMGAAAIPHLESTLEREPDPDSQRARAALLLIYRLRGTAISLAETRRLNSISYYDLDPNDDHRVWLTHVLPEFQCRP